MSKSDTWENAVLQLLFQNLAVSLVGDSGGLQPSAGAGNLYVSLHTSDPGEAGDQTTSETSYTGYARIAVVRSAGGWTVSGTNPTQVVNAALVTFGGCTVGTPTITYCGIGTSSAGAGKLLYSGVLTAPLAVSPGITPQFAIGTLVITEG